MKFAFTLFVVVWCGLWSSTMILASDRDPEYERAVERADHAFQAIDAALARLRETPGLIASVEGLPVVAVDLGNEWVVTFKPVEQKIGGIPMIFVDQTTFEVRELVLTQ